MHYLRFFVAVTFTGVVVTSASAGGLLLIPDSGLDKVWAFDPFDGSVVNNNFIPDDGRMDLPLTPLDSGHGTILLSDQNADAVFEYGYDGSYIRTIADGPTNGLDNVRGIAVYNDQIYVCVDSGTTPDSIQRFDMDGSGQTTWATGIGSGWFIKFRGSDALVSDSGDDNIERFDLDGNPLTPFHDSDGVVGIDFPQQLCERDNGNILAAGFSVPAGIYQYDSLGNELNYYDIDLAIRGLWELENGKFLFTGGTRVGTYDPVSGEVVDIVNDLSSSFRHIGYTPIPEPSGLLLLTAVGALALRRR